MNKFKILYGGELSLGLSFPIVEIASANLD